MADRIEEAVGAYNDQYQSKLNIFSSSTSTMSLNASQSNSLMQPPPQAPLEQSVSNDTRETELAYPPGPSMRIALSK